MAQAGSVYYWFFLIYYLSDLQEILLKCTGNSRVHLST